MIREKALEIELNMRLESPSKRNIDMSVIDAIKSRRKNEERQKGRELEIVREKIINGI
jgi:hypothetical protein